MPVYKKSGSRCINLFGSKQNPLEHIVRDMKKHTSSELKVAIKSNAAESRKEWMNWMFDRAGKKTAIMRTGPESIWEQEHNQPIEIKDQKMFDRILDYIHMNPVVSGFVDKPEDWK